jgi:uncharacterized membrane protein
MTENNETFNQHERRKSDIRAVLFETVPCLSGQECGKVDKMEEKLEKLDDKVSRKMDDLSTCISKKFGSQKQWMIVTLTSIVLVLVALLFNLLGGKL